MFSSSSAGCAESPWGDRMQLRWHQTPRTNSHTAVFLLQLTSCLVSLILPWRLGSIGQYTCFSAEVCFVAFWCDFDMLRICFMHSYSLLHARCEVFHHKCSGGQLTQMLMTHNVKYYWITVINTNRFCGPRGFFHLCFVLIKHQVIILTKIWDGMDGFICYSLLITALIQAYWLTGRKASSYLLTLCSFSY